MMHILIQSGRIFAISFPFTQQPKKTPAPKLSVLPLAIHNPLLSFPCLSLSVAGIINCTSHVLKHIL